ncbi:MAG: hypothetical protein JNK27_11485 [Chitinophagaceae bacterium]|nr:hypothetical protein [Chitinophagaceae bacterium]
MSGIRLYSFREGDRSEYLANYLLSGLGLVTAVPRQEDIGFDFYCQLANEETGNLSFGFPFVIQVKSSGEEKIVYGDSDLSKWKAENLSWLFRLEIPLLIGVIHKKEMRLDIYNTSALNFIFFEFPNPTLLELTLRNNPDRKDLHGVVKESLEGCPSDKGDGNKYIVDLGNPIITLTNDDIYDKDILKKKKEILRAVLFYEQQSLLYKKLGIPHFYWTFNIETDKGVTPAWMHQTIQGQSIESLYSALAPSLISLALNLKARGQMNDVVSLKTIFTSIPGHLVPDEIKKSLPEIFP